MMSQAVMGFDGKTIFAQYAALWQVTVVSICYWTLVWYAQNLLWHFTCTLKPENRQILTMSDLHVCVCTGLGRNHLFCREGWFSILPAGLI